MPTTALCAAAASEAATAEALALGRTPAEAAAAAAAKWQSFEDAMGLAGAALLWEAVRLGRIATAQVSGGVAAGVGCGGPAERCVTWRCWPRSHRLLWAGPERVLWGGVRQLPAAAAAAHWTAV